MKVTDDSTNPLKQTQIWKCKNYNNLNVSMCMFAIAETAQGHELGATLLTTLHGSKQMCEVCALVCFAWNAAQICQPLVYNYMSELGHREYVLCCAHANTQSGLKWCFMCLIYDVHLCQWNSRFVF